MNNVPFTIRGVRTGLVDLEGIVRLEGAELALEFRTRHPLSRFIPSATREVRIPLCDLEEVSFRRFLCLGFLIVRARRMSAFKDVPGSHGAVLRLRCRPAHFNAARELESCLGMSLATQDLKTMVDSVSAPAELPPTTMAPPQSAPGASPKTKRQGAKPIQT